MRAECVPVKSTDPVYIIHTSGTTGAPKGVLRDAGGHAVGLHLSISYLFDIHGPGDVICTASDIGWVVGHSYIIYAPLLVGATTVMYEGKPVGTPDAGAFWRLVEEYNIKCFVTAPTALRAIKRDDPENKHLAAVGERGGLKSLKGLFLAGERSEPSIIEMYEKLLQKYCGPASHVVDHWWSTESGSPMTGRALVPHTGHHRESDIRDHPPPECKHGSAGKAMPGFDVRVVDDEGKEVPRGTMGNIVLGMPLAPTAFTTLWGDEERFYKSYLKRFDGKWMDTGDAGMIDEEGYLFVMSRNDDVLNVSAHRLSSGKSPNHADQFLRLQDTNLTIVKAALSKPSHPIPSSQNAASSASRTPLKATSPSPSSPSPPPTTRPPQSQLPNSPPRSKTRSANKSARLPPSVASSKARASSPRRDQARRYGEC